MDSGQGSSEIEPETLFAPSNFPVANQEQYIFYDFEIPQVSQMCVTYSTAAALHLAFKIRLPPSFPCFIYAHLACLSLRRRIALDCIVLYTFNDDSLEGSQSRT